MTLPQQAPRAQGGVALLGGLDPLGHRRQPALAGEREHAAGQPARRPGAVEPGGVATGDLDDGDGVVGEAARPGVAGAVVQREPHPQTDQTGEAGPDGAGVGQRPSLGHLQQQLRRRDTRVGERLADRGHQARVLQLARGDVHPDEEGGRVGRQRGPARHLLQRAGQSPPPQRTDRPRRLGHRQEPLRRQVPAGPVGQSHQGLRPDDGTGPQVDHRLVLQPQPAVLDRPGQPGARAVTAAAPALGTLSAP